MTQHTATPLSSAFVKSEDGAATPIAIAFCIIFIVLGGVAVDFNKAVSERTQLQLATDSAAHAALYTREFETAEDSITAAMATIEGMLPDIAYKDALKSTDIEFGYFNENTGEFTVDQNSRSAVRVNAELAPERLNASKNIFLAIIGWDTFTIRATSTYGTYFPPCFNEGYVAESVVDLQSGSSYTDGFCIHSNTYVSLNQNNYFEPGTVVSMPSLDDLDIPNSGFKKNDGLEEALRAGAYRMRLLRQLPRRFESLRDGSPEYAAEAGVTREETVLWPINENPQGNNSGVTRFTETDSGKKTITPAAFDQQNRIYKLECSGNGDITLSGDTFSDFALVTNCDLKFSNGTILESVIIATEGDVDASHVQIGRDDNCAPDGGAQIWTYGDVKTASDLSGFGAQILALGDIQFTANASGIEGVSFISNGRIDGTSNSSMGFCSNAGTENFQTASYFRMLN